jgi:hypothetical protein
MTLDSEKASNVGRAAIESVNRIFVRTTGSQATLGTAKLSNASREGLWRELSCSVLRNGLYRQASFLWRQSWFTCRYCS